uniref:TAP-C domain-containing protein n=1 Tax=Amphimedon queenslandica TaxID=400682 RepID=A0A1X7V6T0_AMPQE
MMCIDEVHSQHDDRWDDGPSSSGNDDYRSSNRGYRGGRGGRGGGNNDQGRWTRGGGPRGRGRDRGYNDREREDYGNERGGFKSFKGKNRYTPYDKSPPGVGGMRSSGGVFDRIGPREQRGRGFNRDQSGGPRRDVFGRGRMGSDNRGRGWRNDRYVETTGERRVYNRTDSDMMEEDSSSILLKVLGQRYDSITMSLNLSDMFHDPTLHEHKIRSSMFDASFVNTVLDLVATHCPQLVALNLSNNRLQRLQAYSSLRDKCPSIESLDLSGNELHSPQELEAIAPLPSVKSLILEGNPFRDQEFSSYASVVRKYFPNLELLDGKPLPDPVKFDLPTNIGTIPPSQKGYLVNEDIRSLVVSFLEQYFSLYDGETRDKLLEAYSDNAVFSLSVDVSPQQRGPPLQQYMSSSRNLARVNDPGKRSSLIKHGRIDIVQFLRQFPQSCHISSSFSVDVMKANPMCTGFNVYGLFGEAGRMDSPIIRAFTRTFVIVAAGTGVAIVNDQLTIRNATMDSVKRYSDEVQAHFSKSSAGSVSLFPPNQSAIPSLQQQQLSAAQAASFNESDVIQQLALETGMNYDYSKKCLAENGWNYEKAISTFRVLQGQGNIPLEAFRT